MTGETSVASAMRVWIVARLCLGDLDLLLGGLQHGLCLGEARLGGLELRVSDVELARAEPAFSATRWSAERSASHLGQLDLAFLLW